MTAHDIKLKRRRIRRTTLATIPLCATRFAISPPMIAVRKFGLIIVSISNCTLEFWIREVRKKIHAILRSTFIQRDSLLLELRVENYAVIDNVAVEFAPG